MNPPADHSALSLLAELMRDPVIFDRVCEKQMKSLNLDDVARLLDVSERKLKDMIKNKEWVMVIGPNGKYQMTLEQFRVQQRLLLTPKHMRKVA